MFPRVDELTAAMVEGYRARIPDYPELLARHQEDVYAVSRMAVLLFLQLLIENRDPTDAELDLIRSAGRARAAQGLALESMLVAYSVGREIAWAFISAEGEKVGVDEEDVSAATLLMARFMEKMALVVTQGFLDHMRAAYQEEQRRMGVLIEIAKAMSRSLDLDEVVNVGLERIRKALGVDWAGFWLVSVEKGSLRLYAHQADLTWGDDALAGALSQVPLDDPSLGAAAVAGKPVLFAGPELPRSASAAGAKMIMVVPILHRERPLGVIGAASSRVDDLAPRDREFLVAMAEQMAVAVHQVQEHMREARTDFLTGLANRHEFDSFLRREVARAERFGDPLSLAMIDLDGLKRINDERGHKAGDEALRTVGATLKATVRSLDLAARIGGDEFALVMPQTDAAGARDVLARFGQHVDQARSEGRSEASVSVGFCQWQEGMSLDLFCSAADAELYAAKRSRPLAHAEPIEGLQKA